MENEKTKVFFDNEEYLNSISEILKDKDNIQLSLYCEKEAYLISMALKRKY